MNFLKCTKKTLLNPIMQLIVVIALAFFVHSSLSENTIKFFLTISVCLRETLIFVLPFLLFSFVAVALSAIKQEGMFFILGLMATVMVSNFLNILISGTFGFFILSDAHAQSTTGEALRNITPFFQLNLPEIISTTQALAAGVIVGFYNSLRPNQYITATIDFMHKCVMIFMKKFFIPLLPIFVGGFMLKLFSEGRMTGFIENNAVTCVTIFCFLWCYLALWLFVAASFHASRAAEIFKNSFPAIVTAFSTMSSASALPMSLEAARKNTGDKILSDAVMPLTLNFHMVGDTIIVPIMAMIVMLAFNHPLPGITNFLMFGIFFVLNKFAGGGVPSGTIMVTIPVLREYFGFDDSMIAFIIAFYGIIDPIATSGNVAANNFFVVIFQKIRSGTKKCIVKAFRRNRAKAGDESDTKLQQKRV